LRLDGGVSGPGSGGAEAEAEPVPSGRSPEIEARIREEALFGRLPLLAREREYSTRGILATGFAYAVAAWCFLIGGYAANVVGAVQGIVALIAGCVIGVTLSAAASALACNRYGIEQIDFTKTCFGQNGAKIILLFYIINQIGWTGMILVMFGRGVMNVAVALHLAQASEWIARGAVLSGLIVGYIVVVRGVHVLNVFNAIVTPGLIIATGLLFYVIFHNAGWHGILARAPLEPAADPKLGYVIALEYGLGAGFSWWPGIGFLTRNTDTQRNSLYPQVLTMGLGMGVVCCTGLLAGLLYRTFDPTVWMMQAGGRVIGVLALALVAIANISASAMMLYTASLALRHVRALRGLAWRKLSALATVPVLAYVAFPYKLYDKGSAFLAYNATMFAPISGVLLVDYFFLRHRRLNVSQLFEDAPSGHYRFHGGFNLASLFCMVLGQVLYVWLLDPVSLAARGPVRLLTASGPAVLLPMVLYYLLARLVLIPLGKGGYGASEAPIPIQRPNI
jgi:NCS1 family nucleobase:cation symporter-1